MKKIKFIAFFMISMSTSMTGISASYIKIISRGLRQKKIAFRPSFNNMGGHNLSINRTGGRTNNFFENYQRNFGRGNLVFRSSFSSINQVRNYQKNLWRSHLDSSFGFNKSGINNLLITNLYSGNVGYSISNKQIIFSSKQGENNSLGAITNSDDYSESNDNNGAISNSLSSPKISSSLSKKVIFSAEKSENNESTEEFIDAIVNSQFTNESNSDSIPSAENRASTSEVESKGCNTKKLNVESKKRNSSILSALDSALLYINDFSLETISEIKGTEFIEAPSNTSEVESKGCNTKKLNVESKKRNSSILSALDSALLYINDFSLETISEIKGTEFIEAPSNTSEVESKGCDTKKLNVGSKKRNSSILSALDSALLYVNDFSLETVDEIQGTEFVKKKSSSESNGSNNNSHSTPISNGIEFIKVSSIISEACNTAEGELNLLPSLKKSRNRVNNSSLSPVNKSKYEGFKVGGVAIVIIAGGIIAGSIDHFSPKKIVRSQVPRRKKDNASPKLDELLRVTEDSFPQSQQFSSQKEVNGINLKGSPFLARIKAVTRELYIALTSFSGDDLIMT